MTSTHTPRAQLFAVTVEVGHPCTHFKNSPGLIYYSLVSIVVVVNGNFF